MSETLDFRVEGNVLWITLLQPELSGDAHATLWDAWHRYRYDPDLWVAVLTGRDDVFCLGDRRSPNQNRDSNGAAAWVPERPNQNRDIDGAAAWVPERPNQNRDSNGAAAWVPERLSPRRVRSPMAGWWYEHYRVRESNVWKPVIVAVNGACAGSALTFVGQCDIVLASDRATFSLPQVEQGQVPWREVTYLSDRLPLMALNRLALFGSAGALSADRAQALGLVAEVVEHQSLPGRAAEVAANIAAQSGTSVRGAAAALHLTRDLGYLDGLMMAFAISDRYQEHRDSKEGPVAFSERRRADWSRQ